MRPLALLVMTAVGLITRSALAAPLPDTLTTPAGFTLDDKYGKQFDYFHVELGIAGKHTDVAGKTWIVRFAATPPNKTSNATDAAIRSALKAQGWELDTPSGTLIAHHANGATVDWLSGAAFSGDFRATIVEAGPPPHALTLPAPAKTPETIADTDDFPYLAKFPGATLEKTQIEKRTFDATAPGQKEVLVGPPIVTKTYRLPATASPYERMVVYRDALTAAGWTIVRTGVGTDSLVVAHYAKDGRDIFAYLHDATASVADVGAQNDAKKLADALAKDGHVAIYGIYFDTDKDLLKPESETALGHVLELLKADPKLRVEVQGHTDNTGTPARNQPLSDARAAAVKKWLVDHGVAADRMTPKGYGATVPVADNATPEGRAKNRRVELRRL